MDPSEAALKANIPTGEESMLSEESKRILLMAIPFHVKGSSTPPSHNIFQAMITTQLRSIFGNETFGIPHACPLTGETGLGRFFSGG